MQVGEKNADHYSDVGERSQTYHDHAKKNDQMRMVAIRTTAPATLTTARTRRRWNATVGNKSSRGS